MKDIEKEVRDIEQRFFETFEIESRPDYGFSTEGKRIESFALYYPEITDRMLLDIAKVLVDWTGSLLIVDKNIKKEILGEAIFIAHRKDTDEFVRQVQALFKEAE